MKYRNISKFGLPDPRSFPGENRRDYERLSVTLMDELDPKTPHEELIAKNLVQLEVDAIQLRQFRDEILYNAMVVVVDRRISQRAFAHYPSEADIDLDDVGAFEEHMKNWHADMTSSDPLTRDRFWAFLEQNGYRAIAIQAEAYAEVADRLASIEAKLVASEPRRRRLVNDYDQLLARRPVYDDDEGMYDGIGV